MNGGLTSFEQYCTHGVFDLDKDILRRWGGLVQYVREKGGPGAVHAVNAMKSTRICSVWKFTVASSGRRLWEPECVCFIVPNGSKYGKFRRTQSKIYMHTSSIHVTLQLDHAYEQYPCHSAACLEPRPSSLRSECSTFVKRAWENCRPSWKL